MVAALSPELHFDTDEYGRDVELTEAGVEHVERALECGILHDERNLLLLTQVNCALHARVLLRRDVDYIVKDDRIQLVEGFTDEGTPSLQRIRPALAVLFAYCPADGTVRLKSPLRAADRVRDRKAAGARIYPPGQNIFAAFDATPFDAVKVVVLGQDPYHGPGQAHGLCFSVLPGVPVPPSLDNIFKEIQRDLGIARPDHGCLLPWARRGVLLLNATLTVEGGKAGSHARVGWQRFTDRVLQAVSARQAPVAFLLWGNHACSKAPMLDAERHLVHLSNHPSPLAAYRGFFKSRPFSKANAFLAARGTEPIDWKIGCDCEG